MGDTIVQSGVLFEQDLCGIFQGPWTSGAEVTIICSSTMMGRYLTIQLREPMPLVLTLDEVIVCGEMGEYLLSP